MMMMQPSWSLFFSVAVTAQLLVVVLGTGNRGRVVAFAFAFDSSSSSSNSHITTTTTTATIGSNRLCDDGHMLPTKSSSFVSTSTTTTTTRRRANYGRRGRLRSSFSSPTMMKMSSSMTDDHHQSYLDYYDSISIFGSSFSFGGGGDSMTTMMTQSFSDHSHHAMTIAASSVDAAALTATSTTTTTTTTAIATTEFLPTAVLGSSCIMLTIVLLLYIWEESVETLRHELPTELRPVIESILGELSGLGFIGLLLQLLLGGGGDGGFQHLLQSLSTTWFGEDDILVEDFEFLHTAFFEVGVGFFVAAGVMVAVGLRKLEEINDVEAVNELQFDLDRGVCSAITPDILAKYIPPNKQQRQDGEDDDRLQFLNHPTSLLIDEIFMSTQERAALSLLLRCRILERFPDLVLSPETFRVESYIRQAFSSNLLKMVELSPLTWIYLIPALALANSIDLSHEVVNASSPNAAESVGFFVSTPWAIIPSTLSVVLSLVWGTWNCIKVTRIKYMLIPTLGSSDPGTTGTGDVVVSIDRPPIDDPALFTKFVNGPLSSPGWVQPIERIWSSQQQQQPRTQQTKFQQLFGTAVGNAGLELYQNSIKFQAWLCITQIVFFGTQIVTRDLDALLLLMTTSGGSTSVAVGNPDNLVPELVVHGLFVVLSLLQLTFVSSRAFWNYCLVSCLGDDEDVKKLIAKSQQR